MIYADFKSTPRPEHNRKQDPDEPYANKYQKHVACCYGYKLVCAHDKFSKSFKSNVGEDAIFNFLTVWTNKAVL